jgi:hypothetical protein
MPHEASPNTHADMYPPAGFVLEDTQPPPPPSGQGIVPALPQNQGPERSVHKHTRAFQSPFKLCASRISAWEAHKKKDNIKNGSSKKKKEDEMV